MCCKLKYGSKDIIDKYYIMEGAIKKYSKLMKKGKTHRSVLDRHNQDVREIKASVPVDANSNNRSDGNVDMSKVINGNTHIKEEIIRKLLDKMNSM